MRALKGNFVKLHRAYNLIIFVDLHFKEYIDITLRLRAIIFKSVHAAVHKLISSVIFQLNDTLTNFKN